MSKTDGTTPNSNEELRRQVELAEERKTLEERLAAATSEKKQKAPKAKKERQGLSPLWIALTSVIAVVVAVALAAGIHFYVMPAFSEKAANRDLLGLSAQRGPIQVSNTTLETFSGQTIEGANVEQKALTSGGSEEPEFIFTNGKTGDKKRVDLYLDFSQQGSRDFILLNQSELQTMVENGAVDLHLHAIPGGSVFAMYGAEAVAEAATLAPKDTWGYLVSVLKLSAELQGENLTNKEIAKKLGQKASDAGIKGIDAESIQNGTFASWLLSVGDDSRIEAGVSLPAVYLNEALVDTENLDLNDSTAFRRYISNN